MSLVDMLPIGSSIIHTTTRDSFPSRTVIFIAIIDAAGLIVPDRMLNC